MERRIKHSYTNSYTKIQLLKVSHEVSQKWNRSALEADFAIAGSIKFRIFNCRKLQNSYTYSDTKITVKQEKTATEVLLLRFVCGATGNRTRDTRIFSPLLYQLSYGTKFLLRTTLSFDWDCKGRHFFLICKFIFKKIRLFSN